MRKTEYVDEVEQTRKRLYPKPPPFSAREWYQKVAEERKKPYEYDLKDAPRLTGRFTINGIERETVKFDGPSKENVDHYIELLKKSRPARVQEFKPELMLSAEIPVSLQNPTNKNTSRPGPRPVRAVFDKSDRFKSNIPKLSSNLPDLQVTRSFKRYVETNGERIPNILLQTKF